MSEQPSTVVLDTTYAGGSSPTGIGVYSREILHALRRCYPQTHFVPALRWRQLRAVNAPGGGGKLLLPPLWVPRGNLFHGLNQRLPFGLRDRAVATFHDLFVITGDYSEREFRARFKRQAKDAAARADVIIAVSAFTAGQVHDLLGFPKERIFVVPHGIHAPDPARIPAVGDREPITLFVGSLQARKNVLRLIEAFEALPSPWRFVLVGGEGYGAGEIERRLAESPAKGRIVREGYVTAEALHSWYRRASILAFPSLDEGFGIPVLEAMSWGLPVLTSDGSALAEVAGGAAVLVDPLRTESIADGLLRLAQDESLRADCRVRGLQHASLFSWERSARETMQVYRLVLG